MARVLLNLGSNIRRHYHLCAGLDALRERFGALSLSRVFESEAIGFRGDPFYNLAVSLHSDLSPGALAADLRELEYDYGRPLDAQRYSARTLDIDILTIDELVGCIEGVDLPRAEILYNAFVLRPLAELVPDALHPALGRSYAELWAAFDQGSQPLRAVDFQWGEQMVSRAEAAG